MAPTWKSNKDRPTRSRSPRRDASSTPRGYKADLNKLFDTGEVPERFKRMMAELDPPSTEATDRQRLVRAMRSAETQVAFDAAASKLVAKHALPDDVGLLLRALDHHDEAVVQAALDGLIEMDGRRPLPKRALIKARLKTLRAVAEQDHTLTLVELLAERI